jgi:hypothetical protein
VREEDIVSAGIIGLGLERGRGIILDRHITELNIVTVNLEMRN